MTTDEHFTIVDDLVFAIMDEDKEDAKFYLDTILQRITEGDVQLGTIMVQPSTVQTVKELLIDKFGANPRAMQLKSRVSSTQKRAFLITKAMINGVTW